MAELVVPNVCYGSLIYILQVTVLIISNDTADLQRVFLVQCLVSSAELWPILFSVVVAILLFLCTP